MLLATRILILATWYFLPNTCYLVFATCYQCNTNIKFLTEYEYIHKRKYHQIRISKIFICKLGGVSGVLDNAQNFIVFFMDSLNWKYCWGKSWCLFKFFFGPSLTKNDISILRNVFKTFCQFFCLISHFSKFFWHSNFLINIPSPWGQISKGQYP